MTAHGGRRPRSGRPLRGERPASIVVRVRVTESEHAELTGGIRDGETLSDVLREGGLRLVRARRT